MKRIILMLMMATGVMTSLAITPIDSLELRRLQQMADSVVGRRSPHTVSL